MNISEVTIIQALGPVILGVLGWFMRSIAHDMKDTMKAMQASQIEMAKSVSEVQTKLLLFDKDIQLMKSTLDGMRTIRDEWALIKKDLDTLTVEMKSMKEMEDEVVILKRDQQTIWKKLDEARK